MTMDKSLKVRKGATSVRGVLTRAERIAKLKEQEAFPDGRSPIGLPKVRVQKVAMKKKKKTKEDAEATAKPGEKAPAAAGGKKK
jgi:small basic protein (TIGR04137 family)